MNPIDVALALIVVSMVVATYRILAGPAKADRGAGADLVFFGFVSFVSVLGLRLSTELVIDIVLVCTLVGFMSALSLARLIAGGKR